MSYVKNKPKQITKNHFDLIYVEAKKDTYQIVSNNCHLGVGIKSNFIFTLYFYKLWKKDDQEHCLDYGLSMSQSANKGKNECQCALDTFP